MGLPMRANKAVFVFPQEMTTPFGFLVTKLQIGIILSIRKSDFCLFDGMNKDSTSKSIGVHESELPTVGIFLE